MKHIVAILGCLFLLASCKKEITPFFNGDVYLQNVQAALKDSLGEGDYAGLDVSKSVLSKVDSIGLSVLRIPFKGKKFENDFVLLKTNEQGMIERGKIIHQEGAAMEIKWGDGEKKSFNGCVSVTSLDRKTVLNSPIVNGFVTAFHSPAFARTALVLPSDVMPEVVITYVIHSGDSFSFSYWMNLQSYFYDAGSWGNYYGSMDGGAQTGGGPSGNPSGGNPPPGNGDGSSAPYVEVPMLIDFENQDENTAIDIEKFIHCFDAISDAGAMCTIEIMADIPVDKDPNKLFDFETKSPGHTFINIRKKNATQSVSQNIGFYPKSGWKTILTNAPMDGKLVDNSEHEFNCEFALIITPEQLQAALNQMRRSKDYQYDLDNYNCTDWALDVFNAAGGNLQIPLYDIPGNYLSTGTRTPNGVYNKLKEMKVAGDPRASGIAMDYQKAYAGESTGPCN